MCIRDSSWIAKLPYFQYATFYSSKYYKSISYVFAAISRVLLLIFYSSQVSCDRIRNVRFSSYSHECMMVQMPTEFPQNIDFQWKGVMQNVKATQSKDQKWHLKWLSWSHMSYSTLVSMLKLLIMSLISGCCHLAKYSKVNWSQFWWQCVVQT